MYSLPRKRCLLAALVGALAQDLIHVQEIYRTRSSLIATTQRTRFPTSVSQDGGPRHVTCEPDSRAYRRHTVFSDYEIPASAPAHDQRASARLNPPPKADRRNDANRNMNNGWQWQWHQHREAHTSAFCCPPESCRSPAALPASPFR